MAKKKKVDSAGQISSLYREEQKVNLNTHLTLN